MTDAKPRILDSQRALLNSLAQRELDVARFYETCAARFRESTDYWNGIAAEEHGHAAMLQALHRHLDAGFLLWNLGLFRDESTGGLPTLIQDAIEAVTAGTMDEHEALLAAVGIENSLLESRFYTQINTEAPGFAQTAATLLADTREHGARLHARLEATRPKEPKMPAAERLPPNRHAFPTAAGGVHLVRNRTN